MGKLQDKPCPGCDSCPIIATSDSIDSINFSTKVNCLLYEQPLRGRLSARKPRDQRIPSGFDWTYKHRQEIWLPNSDEDHQIAEEKKRRDTWDLSQIDADAFGLSQQTPEVFPLWQQFTQGAGSDRTPRVARSAFQLMTQLLRLYSPEAARAEVVRSRKELINLCERVVRAWDAADDKMDMQEAIEELDSLLYDLDKREGLSGS